MRDAIKIFVGNVEYRTTQQELTELFEKYGTVVSCAVMNQYAFVHMRVSDHATKAIEELNGHELHGKKLVVELSKPRPQNTWKIFIGNVGTDCDASELRNLFEKYGNVMECDVVKDYAFVHMENESDAREAIDKLNGREIRGRRINVEMSSKANRPMGGNDSGRSRRSYEYRDAPQSRAEAYNRRRATEATYASYALKSPYERYGGDSERYDAYDSRVRPPSPMYYSRDRSPLRRSPTRAYYEEAMTSSALAQKYRTAATDYSSLSSAYGVQTTPSLSSAYSSQTSALASAYAARAAAAAVNQMGYESQTATYGADTATYNAQTAAAYRQQVPTLTTGYAAQIPAMAASYTTQTAANPYGSISTTTPYASATAYRQQQGTAYDPSQISGLGTQAAYSSLQATNDALMYERTGLSPPRSATSDGFKKASDAYKSFGGQRSSMFLIQCSKSPSHI
ncbi:RNA-binding protein 14-like isoform X2 [Phyllobates terribilis]|uniref:RNA-binding protein 14-like isoform X2 n=1 Tax=Phyllobates terribilis TaxID=111132 RepID=UPI003CCADFC0